MTKKSRMQEYIELVEKLAPTNGVHETRIEKLLTFKDTTPSVKHPMVYDPGFIIAANGSKNLYVEGKKLTYGAGSCLAMMLPMPVECELVDVSEDKPFCGTGFYFDSERISRMLLKLERSELGIRKPEVANPSAFMNLPLTDKLLDAVIRLLKVCCDPVEASVLGSAILDEVYFRILTSEHGIIIRQLLEQKGAIQQISRAVEYVHQNVSRVISVDEMADVVNMSSSGFHKKFKEVMHLSPLQYTKQIKLNRAKTYIMDGASVSEAGYKVGYNSPAQFSREYKRHFGVVPSMS